MPKYKVIESSENKVFKVQVNNLTGNFRTGIRQGFWETGKELVKTASSEIKRKKTGKVYKYKGRRIRAGAAGDYPANRSGANRRSLDFQVHGADELEFGAGVDYSPFLERGTSKMKARPFLKPSITKNINKLRSNLRNNIRRAIRGR